MHWLEKALYRVRPAFLAAFLKTVFRIRRRVTPTKSGDLFWIDPVSHLGREILDTGTYEPEAIEVLTALLRHGDTFVDVGANEGFFSVVCSRLVGPKGKVISIEPQARLVPVIEKNLSQNRIQNTKLENTLLSDEPGETFLYLASTTNTGASSQFARAKMGRTQKVSAQTLDRVVTKNAITHIRLLKIDCEGAEEKVIQGANQTLARCRADFIYLEFHPQITGPEAPARIDQTLRKCGYELTQLAGGVWIYHTEETRTALEPLGIRGSIPPSYFRPSVIDSPNPKG